MNIDYTSLTKYMFTNDNINDLAHKYDYLKKKEEKISIVSNNVATVKKKDWFLPSMEVDMLFWCFNIFKNGFLNYELNYENSFEFEKKKKIEIVSKMNNKQIKQLLKKEKIKLSETKVNILNDKQLTLSALLAIIIIEKAHFLFIDGKSYYEYNASFDELDTSEEDKIKNTCIIIKDKKDTKSIYSLYTNDLRKKIYIENTKKKLFKKYKYDKLMPPISKYKVNDLYIICERYKLNYMLENGKKMNKNNIYDLIYRYLSKK